MSENSQTDYEQIKYKIGDIAKILNMTTEGIRYYEECGIIQPEKNGEANSRWYSVWDMQILIRARGYRKLGFSLKQISAIIKCSEKEVLFDHFTEKEKEIEKKVIENLNLLKRIRQIRHLYSRTENYDGRYRLEDSPGIYRMNTQEQYLFLNDPGSYYPVHTLARESPFVFATSLFKREEIEKDVDNFYFGFGVDEEYFDYLDLKKIKDITYHPPVLSVFTVISSQSDIKLSPCKLAGALEYMKQNGLSLAGDIFSILIDYHKEGEIYKNRHLVWLPVKTSF